MTTQEAIVNHVRYRFSTAKLTAEVSLERSETWLWPQGRQHGGTSILSVVSMNSESTQGLAGSERADAGAAPVTSW